MIDADDVAAWLDVCVGLDFDSLAFRSRHVRSDGVLR
jgi:hypothetical protein